MKNASYTNGNGIKAVSHLPACLIKLTGWLDSHKSMEVANAHLDKYLSVLAKNEKDEALLAEEALKEIRARGSACLHTILHSDASTVPQNNTSDTSPHAKRAHSRAVSEHKNKVASIEKAKKELLEIDDAIISGNVVYEERLEKTRNKALSQINTYIKGVRAGKHHDFDPEITPDDLARTKYYNSHKEKDEFIHKIAKEAI